MARKETSQQVKARFEAAKKSKEQKDIAKYVRKHAWSLKQGNYDKLLKSLPKDAATKQKLQDEQYKMLKLQNSLREAFTPGAEQVQLLENCRLLYPEDKVVQGISAWYGNHGCMKQSQLDYLHKLQ